MKDTNKDLQKNMHDRFIQVFRHLEEQGSIVKNSHEELNWTLLTEAMGMKEPSQISHWLNHRRLIPWNKAVMFAEVYEVNLNWLFLGQGEMFMEHEQQETR